MSSYKDFNLLMLTAASSPRGALLGRSDLVERERGGDEDGKGGEVEKLHGRGGRCVWVRGVKECEEFV